MSQTESHLEIDLGNNEGRSSDGVFLAMTLSQSKTLKTRKGAEKWLAQRGYGPNGQRLN